MGTGARLVFYKIIYFASKCDEEKISKSRFDTE
jgi:hypothetical protein